MPENIKSNEKAPIKNINKILLIFLFALILRLVPVIAFKNIGIGLDDMFQYDMLARSIVSGNGYRWYAQDDLNLVEQYIDIDSLNTQYDPRGVLTSFRPPLYPAFLAAIYWFFGVGINRFFYARIIQAILGAFLAPLTYSIAYILWPENKKIPAISAIVVAVYPILVVYPLSLATENLFFLLILLSILLLLKASMVEKWTLFLLSGIILGLTSLTRSVALGFSGLIFLWVLIILRKKKFAFCLLIGLILVISPWMIRNSLLHNKVMGIESALGYDLYVGFHPESTGTFQYGISLDLLPMLDDGARDQIGMEKALQFIKSDPGRDIYLVIRKIGYFMSLEKRALVYLYTNNYFGYFPYHLMWTLLILFLSPFMIIAISGSLGLILMHWNRINMVIMLLILGYAIPHFLILAEPRFHLALVPIFAMGTAFFWVKGYKLLKYRGPNKKLNWKFICSIIVIGLLIVNWVFEIVRDYQIFADLLSIGGNTRYLPY